MKNLDVTIRVLGLGLAVLLAQACQQAEQPAAENQPDAPANAASSPTSDRKSVV